MSRRILVAEDELKIAELLADYFRAAGMHATLVHDGGQVLQAIRDSDPDLLVLDVMLPNVDGMSLCRQIRADSNLPIIMLTARFDEVDRLLGLELGADDYIGKPFSPREVVARAKAVLRRTEPAARDTSAVAIDVDEARMQVRVNGAPLDLTPVEFRLIRTLAAHPGRVYRRAELLDLIYDDYREVSDRTVDSHIKNLRRKLVAHAPDLNLIHSVYGIGYKLDTTAP